MQPSRTAKALIARHPIISDQIDPGELLYVLSAGEQALIQSDEGAVVEFGCYQGTTSLFLRRLMDDIGAAERSFHVYDSFAGLPDKTSPDIGPLGEAFQSGELRATRDQLISNFRRARLSLPKVHKAWFADLTPDDIPESIAFAFLDGDYYESIMIPLRHIEQRMAGGALIVVDDYGNDKLPGAKRAVDDWLRTRPQWRLLQSVASLAIIGARGVS